MKIENTKSYLAKKIVSLLIENGDLQEQDRGHFYIAREYAGRHQRAAGACSWALIDKRGPLTCFLCWEPALEIIKHKIMLIRDGLP